MNRKGEGWFFYWKNGKIIRYMKPDCLKKFVDFLKSGDFLRQDQLDKISAESQKEGRPFEDVLREKNYISDENLGNLIAEAAGWRFVSLDKEAVDVNVLKLVPEKVARKQEVIAFGESEDGVKVAMSNPDNAEMIHLLEKKIGKKIVSYYATEKDIFERLSLYRTDIRKEFDSIMQAEIKQAKKGEVMESSAVRIVNLLLERAFEREVSDIHIEPRNESTLVRFRVDGIMEDVIEIPKNLHEHIIGRIKVLSHLRTDEHQAPQDGKIRIDTFGDPLDVRVSIVPTVKGENAVLRVLSEKSSPFSLRDIGLHDSDFQKLSRNIQRPWGMILVTGPTGSGKTTTLYAVLKILNQKHVNIATIEDPVEYSVEGITQIQVNPKTDLTFASGLKSLVRQDPDIIMVGEIRDKETANIAVNSAMTGHLVLSTLHTNDAATTLPRLLDMGIEPFLITSTVNVAIGQRLLRKICPRCIQSYEAKIGDFSAKIPEEVLKKIFDKKEEITLYKGVGCKLCGKTGYLGRIGVFEILEMNDDIRRLIMRNENAQNIKNIAVEIGMTTMFDDALEKVLSGMTTVEEMLRVVQM